MQHCLFRSALPSIAGRKQNSVVSVKRNQHAFAKDYVILLLGIKYLHVWSCNICLHDQKNPNVVWILLKLLKHSSNAIYFSPSSFPYG